MRVTTTATVESRRETALSDRCSFRKAIALLRWKYVVFAGGLCMTKSCMAEVVSRTECRYATSWDGHWRGSTWSSSTRGWPNSSSGYGGPRDAAPADLEEEAPQGAAWPPDHCVLRPSPHANQDAEPLTPSFDDPAGWKMSVASDRYSTFKLLGQMFVVKLKDFVAPDDVVIGPVDPGFVRATVLDRNAPGFVKVIVGAMRLALGRTVRAGAWTHIDVAVVKAKETHGSFLHN
jgi:hypothetical protein